jgi:hypothetical protein
LAAQRVGQADQIRRGTGFEIVGMRWEIVGMPSASGGMAGTGSFAMPDPAELIVNSFATALPGLANLFGVMTGVEPPSGFVDLNTVRPFPYSADQIARGAEALEAMWGAFSQFAIGGGLRAGGQALGARIGTQTAAGLTSRTAARVESFLPQARARVEAARRAVPEMYAMEGAGSVPQTGGAAARGAKWKVGDDIYTPTSSGDPSWTTVRNRYWKNEAAKAGAAEKWGADNVARMQKGRAPQRYNPDKGGMESMDLSHEPIPARDGGRAVVPWWPQDHAAVDPFRKPGY